MEWRARRADLPQHQKILWVLPHRQRLPAGIWPSERPAAGQTAQRPSYHRARRQDTDTADTKWEPAGVNRVEYDPDQGQKHQRAIADPDAGVRQHSSAGAKSPHKDDPCLKSYDNLSKRLKRHARTRCRTIPLGAICRIHRDNPRRSPLQRAQGGWPDRRADAGADTLPSPTRPAYCPPEWPRFPHSPPVCLSK